MDRRDSILKYVTKDQRGIEVGPWYNPLAPKREGYKTLTLDVFDSATLLERAKADPHIPPDYWGNIEDVDLIGSSTHICELIEQRGELGQFDFIVSSHNFEHLPNPIRFLQGCAKVLKPGGVISMAIPDRRGCFDYFRPVSRLGDWIEAWFEDRERPTYAQIFDGAAASALFDDGANKLFSFYRGVDPTKVTARLVLEQTFREWEQRKKENDSEYRDTHCSVFTPSSFELLVRDVSYLGLVSFEVLEIEATPGVEFYAHLRLTDSLQKLKPSNYEAVRNELLHRVLDEAEETSRGHKASQDETRQNRELRAKVEELRQQLIDVSRTIVNMDRTKAYLIDSLELQRAECNRAKVLERELRELRSSTSWRITDPIRRLVTALRR